MARNDVYLNINALSPADAVVTGQQDMTAATVPELVLGDTPTFNFYFTDNTNVWPSWAGNASYSLTWALSDAVAGDFSPAATTGNATPITGGWSVILPLNSYDLVGLLNTKRVGQPYPVTNLWQQLRVTDPSGNEITRAMFWTPVRYRAISDTQNTESASPTGGRFVTVNNVNTLTTPTAAQFYAANPVPTSALGTAANGELLIGNGTGFTKSTLTAGTGITVTNGSGSITIDASGAQETLTATVKNAESVAITKGQVVYLFGATGGFASVKLAYNTSDATSAKTFGVVSSTSIAANGTGTVTCVGVVDGLNLGAYNDGDTLYLGATPGSVTATKPYAPNHLVYVGIVERANAGNGELYVRVQNGYELDEIHDVQINAPKLAGQTLIYDQTNDLWKNARLTGTANQITVTNADAAVTLSIPTNPTLNGNLTATGSIVSNAGLGSWGATPSSGVYGLTLGSMSGTNMYGVTDQNSTFTISGAATEVIGYRSYSSLALGANALTNWYGFNATLASKTGAGTLTNAYAFYANSPTAATNNYAFYSAGSAPSVFGGNLTISGGTLLFNQAVGQYQTFNVNSGGTGDQVEIKYQQVGNGRAGIYFGTATGGLGYMRVQVGSSGGTTALLANSTGNVLIGTTTDSGNGKLQLATHTTSAGGIGFGTDTSIWRVSSGILAVNARLRDGTFSSSYLDLSAGGATLSANGILTLNSGATTALTLDSSQNATFAGWVKATGTVGNPPASGTSFSSSARFGTGNNIALDFGNTVTGYVGAWIQSHDKSDQSINYTLALNPNGGAVTIGGNLTVSGTQNVFALPASASALTNNSTMTFELTSNTSLTIKVRGTDGTIRSVALTLA